jgi:hypothetical protein
MIPVKMDAEIKVLGFEILSRHLGLVEAERFLLNRTMSAATAGGRR